jgi:hypothetical protein
MFTAIEAMSPNYTDINLHWHPILFIYKNRAEMHQG